VERKALYNQQQQVQQASSMRDMERQQLEDERQRQILKLQKYRDKLAILDDYN
jgi:hypothetical protein